jgi:adenosylcobinamide-phosphate synthase
MPCFLSLDYLLLIPLAIILDFALGDPHSWPHPVNLVGRLLTGLENILLSARTFQKLAGALCLFAAVAAVGLSVVFLLYCLGEAVRVVMTVYLAYAGLALGCLLREGGKANILIEAIDPVHPAPAELEAARKSVGLLVSREVAHLQKRDLYRTLAESLSENFNDAFVAPLFWLLLGGPVGLWIYKCASTADSRWGYRHAPWASCGWAAARLDDALAFVPARLSALLLYLSALPRGRQVWPGWGILRRDAAAMESPNAGWSMSAAAWLHGAGMGGPAVYAGKIKRKPWLGPADTGAAAWDFEKIKGLLGHLRKAGLAGAALMWALPPAADALWRVWKW